MRLLLTVVDPQGSALPVDVAVDAPPGTPLATVRDGLTAIQPLCHPRPYPLRHVLPERQDGFRLFLDDGRVDIDSNLVENAIRPLALGRKNYLFAGSHEAAKRAAAVYSFFAMCKKEEVNPFEWLKHVFENIMETKTLNLHTLYPKHFKQLRNM